MSPSSNDPRRRARQLANLRPAPPAPAGNRRHVSHGGYAVVARDRLDARTRRIFDELAVDAPLRDPNGGLPAPDHLLVELLARSLVRLEDVSTYLTTYGIIDATTGEPRPALEVERRLRLEAHGYAQDLGLSPRSRVALGVELARGEGALEAHLRSRYGDDAEGAP